MWSQLLAGIITIPATVPNTKANPGYQISKPPAQINIPASPPDIIQNGFPLLYQKAPIMPPARPIRVLNTKDDNVAGAP